MTLTEIGWGADNPAYRQLFTNLYIPEATPKQMGWFNEMQRMSASPENAVKLQRALVADRRPRPAAEGEDADPGLPLARTTRRCRSRQGEELAAGIPGAAFVPLESKNHILLETEPAWAMFARDQPRIPRSGGPQAPAVHGPHGRRAGRRESRPAPAPTARGSLMP